MILLQRIKKYQHFLQLARFTGFCGCVLLFFVLCQLLHPAPVYAAKRRVIFQLSNLRQWIDVSYQYSGSKTNTKLAANRSARDHEFEQTYHIGIDYAILSRRLANGSLELDIGPNELFSYDRTSDDPHDQDTGFGLEFLFDMVLFERRPYPVSLNASRVQQWINAPFTDHYTLTSQSYGAGFAARNKLFPFQLSYRYFTNETSGLNVDRRQVTDELRFESMLNWGGISSTRLRAKVGDMETSFSGSDREGLATESYDLGVGNLLTWGKLARKNTLSSNYQLRNDSGSSEVRSEQWDEDLELQLGKGLSIGGGYGYSKNAVTLQERVERSSDGWIEHRLYKSLVTRLSYATSETEYLTGLDNQFRYQTSVTYNKQLPKKSNFTLSYSYGYGEIDRNLDDSTLQIFAEAVSVNNLSGVGYLDNINVISNATEADSVRVYVDLGDGVRGFELDPSEFSVRPAGNRTEIRIDTAIVTLHGTAYLVDYNYLTNSSIEYSTETHSVSAALGLFGQRYRLFGTFSVSDQDLISGNDDTSPLTQQTFVQVGVEANHPGTTYGLNYLYLDTSLSTDHTTEAFFSYLKTIGRNLLTLRMTERYSVINQKEGAFSGESGDSQRSNTFMLNVDYRKPLMRNTTMTLWSQLADIRSDNWQDDLSFGLGLESRWYKFELFLNAEMTFSFYEDTISREDLLSLKLRRYF